MDALRLVFHRRSRLSSERRYTVQNIRPILFGLHFDALRMEEVTDRCRAALLTRARLLIGVVNAAKIVNMQTDTQLRDSLLECDVMLADGQSVVWASRWLGKPLPERVAGIDLFSQLLKLANDERRSIYLLGARPEVLEALVDGITKQYPAVIIAGSHHGYFDERQYDVVAEEIRASRADMLFIGISSPKKEIFLGRYAASLGVPLLHGVGGSFDILAGVTKRAPLAWQRAGLEWAYRVLQEPRRLWRRYFTTNSLFLWLALRERVKPVSTLTRARDVATSFEPGQEPDAVNIARHAR